MNNNPSPSRLYASEADVEAIVDGFEQATLPKSSWTHAAHVTVAICYLRRHGYESALERMRTGIRRLNDCHGVANSATSGYHETVTQFYLRTLGAWIGSSAPFSTLDDLANAAVAFADRDLPLRHYSRERLFSPEARREWMEPDLQPLP